MTVKIITDSTADLPKDFCIENNIEVVPLKVLFGEEEYLDGIDLSHQEFFEKLVTSEELPTTSQVNPDQFVKVFNEELKEETEIIGIFISSELSGTYQSAKIAKEDLGSDKIHLVDSLNATFALGALVRQAVIFREQGKSASQITEELNDIKGRLRLFAIIDTLTYLQKGGRMGSATAKIGGLLGIKPVITIADGKVELIGKARGKKKAMDFIAGKIKEYEPNTEYQYSFGNSAAPELCQEFADYICKNSALKPIPGENIGSVIGTHAGPKCVGIAYIEK